MLMQALSGTQAPLQNGSRLRASEAAVYEGHGRPAGPAEPAQQHAEEMRGDREESRLLPVSGTLPTWWLSGPINISALSPFAGAFFPRISPTGELTWLCPSHKAADCRQQILKSC